MGRVTKYISLYVYLSVVELYFYQGASVNRLQMDIKRKTYDIRIWKRKTFIS
jgi:hypothetical protein